MIEIEKQSRLLAQLQEAVQTQVDLWSHIPESVRYDIKLDQMEKFVQGWDTYPVDSAKDLMLQEAKRGAETYTFVFEAGIGMGHMLTPFDVGRMRRVTQMLTEEGIRYTGQWQSTYPSSGRGASYHIKASWAVQDYPK